MAKLLVLAPLAGLCFGYEWPNLTAKCFDDLAMHEPSCDSGPVLEAEHPEATLHDGAVLVRMALRSLNSDVVVPVWAVAGSAWSATEIGLPRETVDLLELRPQKEEDLWEASGDRVTTYWPDVGVSVVFQLPNRTRIRVAAVAGHIGSTSQLPHPLVYISARMLKTLGMYLVTTPERQKAVRWCHANFRLYGKLWDGVVIEACEDKKGQEEEEDEAEEDEDESAKDVGHHDPEL